LGVRVKPTAKKKKTIDNTSLKLTSFQVLSDITTTLIPRPREKFNTNKLRFRPASTPKAKRMMGWNFRLRSTPEIGQLGPRSAEETYLGEAGTGKKPLGGDSFSGSSRPGSIIQIEGEKK